MSQIKLFGNNRTRPTAGRKTGARVASREKKPAPGLKAATIVLSVLAVLECLYFICVYSKIPFIAKWREVYIQTAMSTMRHQWLATSFIPSKVINEVMVKAAEARNDQIGMESTWKPEPKPQSEPEPAKTNVTTKPVENEEPVDKEEEAFYELFWELDRDSMEDYLEKHPDALADGWENLYINEAGLDDEGTEIETSQGEQVLAVDAKNQILLVRVRGGSGLDSYLGVLAVAKDPARLSVKNSAYLGGSGQFAGTIAENNNGVLAMTASGFIDEGGTGNGGALAGYAMSDGESRGAHMGWSYKRIELRKDNYLYITDAQSPVHEDTTDAVEFTPALILDGEVLVNDQTRFWGGLNPRTVIGQSGRGEILMLAIEGRQVGRSVGTGVLECASILERHDCMQAMNLDGGTSTILWYDGEYVTRCSTGAPEGRLLPNAFVYEAKD